MHSIIRFRPGGLYFLLIWLFAVLVKPLGFILTVNTGVNIRFSYAHQGVAQTWSNTCGAIFIKLTILARYWVLRNYFLFCKTDSFSDKMTFENMEPCSFALRKTVHKLYFKNCTLCPNFMWVLSIWAHVSAWSVKYKTKWYYQREQPGPVKKSSKVPILSANNVISATDCHPQNMITRVAPPPRSYHHTEFQTEINSSAFFVINVYGLPIATFFLARGTFTWKVSRRQYKHR